MITHCELLSDRLIIITDAGEHICFTRDEAIKLAHGIVHYTNQTAAADLSAIFEPGFNWTILKPATPGNNKPSAARPCKGCGPTGWKPDKDEQKTD